MRNNETVSCIIAAAGNSTRFGAENKIFAPLLGEVVISHTAKQLAKSEDIGEIIIVCREEDILYISDIVKQFKIPKVKKIIKGGRTRSESVNSGLCESDEKYPFIAIHDGARPCVTAEVIKKAVLGAKKHKAAAPGIAVTDTIKKADENNKILQTVDRNNLFRIQTPQIFERELIKKAYESNPNLTDDCAAVEKIGAGVYITEGSEENIKITTKSDMALAEMFLQRRV